MTATMPAVLDRIKAPRLPSPTAATWSERVDENQIPQSDRTPSSPVNVILSEAIRGHSRKHVVDRVSVLGKKIRLSYGGESIKFEPKYASLIGKLDKKTGTKSAKSPINLAHVLKKWDYHSLASALLTISKTCKWEEQVELFAFENYRPAIEKAFASLSQGREARIVCLYRRSSSIGIFAAKGWKGCLSFRLIFESYPQEKSLQWHRTVKARVPAELVALADRANDTSGQIL